MASLIELARDLTPLDPLEVQQLQRLAASWGLLADFCFSDLLLFAPVGDLSGGEFVVLAQVRPTTGQTVYRGDWVGTRLGEDERPLVARSYRNGEILEGEIHLSVVRERVRVLCVPVRRDGKVIGVLTREAAPSIGRQHGELERTYLDVFNRFARMIASGDFPYEDKEDTAEAPRVGDGVLLVDPQGRVEYASPNAVSAFHRVGVHANAEGQRFGELGLDETPIRTAFHRRQPTVQEVERGNEVTVVFRCLPITDRGEVSGAVVLVRDISELRRRDRLLLSKDATIREIHHRVKNNLQTISSLLRLQGRRLDSPEGKAAIEESARRIRSIALVHEILSREAGDDVPFVEIARELSRIMDESMMDPERPFRVRFAGEAGTVPAAPATSLSVVLNELLQNAVDHAFPEGIDLQGTPGEVQVLLERTEDLLTVTVTDDGVGLPDGFDLDASTGLGLSIVRTLVETELAGEIHMRRLHEDGPRRGTEVRVVVPTARF
ncbi:MAG TPA: histidine kinase N-terminal domain-containing protein [Acidimicrobiales bacterium]|nr:histidine kinase N-terminal domain-containing protein [Acidimicrobiales bacterium]